MSSLEYFTSEVEIYSIDEAFLNLSHRENMNKYGSNIRSVEKMFQANCLYKKAGVIMTGLHSDNEYQGNLFEHRRNREQEVELMNIVDQLNKKFGPGTINFGLVRSQSS